MVERQWLSRLQQIAESTATRYSAVEADKPIRFEGLSPGTYAISFVHDENANRQFDLNVLGIPPRRGGRVQQRFAAVFSAGFCRPRLEPDW